MKLNDNLKERKMGLIFLGIWISAAIFYCLWDGWVYEWAECGYSGPNQHFDFNLFDMKWAIVDNQVIYYSTNNLHSIIYLCFFTHLMGCLALLTGNEYFKHGTMALLAFPVIAAMSTIFPLEYHEYIVQIVYDIVHASGIFMGIYLMYNNELKVKKAAPMILFTWPWFIMSRILMQGWPYWENNTNGYFSVNQVNNMPFYFYGLEYGLVVIIFFLVDGLFQFLNTKISNRLIKALYPFIIFTVLCVTFLASGLITLQQIDMNTCR